MAKLVITTKGGDKGTTSLANGERVAKDDRRVELYGTVDECQAALGMARAFCEDGKTAEDIYFIEDISSARWRTLQVRLRRAGPDDTREHVRPREGLPAGRDDGFVRPGDTKCGAALHLARTIARRAERVRDAALPRRSNQRTELQVPEQAFRRDLSAVAEGRRRF